MYPAKRAGLSRKPWKMRISYLDYTINSRGFSTKFIHFSTEDMKVFHNLYPLFHRFFLNFPQLSTKFSTSRSRVIHTKWWSYPQILCEITYLSTNIIHFSTEIMIIPNSCTQQCTYCLHQLFTSLYTGSGKHESTIYDERFCLRIASRSPNENSICIPSILGVWHGFNYILNDGFLMFFLYPVLVLRTWKNTVFFGVNRC